jgi:thioredoxin-like negative regulator of GroEL
MSKFNFILFLFLLLNSYISSKKVILPKGVDFPRTGNVYYISDNTIDELSKYYDYIFFTSYSDWCKSCLKYESNFEKIFKIIENDPDFPSVAFGKFFATYNRKTSIKFEIRGFPTLLLINNGIKVAEYLGGNSIEEIVGFLRNKLFLGAQKINSLETYKILVNNVRENKFIVLFGNKFLKPFKDVSIEYEKIIFGYVEDNKLMEELNGNENDIVFYTNQDEGKFYLNNSETMTVEKLENFVFTYNHFLVQLFNQDFSDRMISNKNNFLLFINKNNDKFDYEHLRTIAKEIRNNTIVSLINYEDKVNKNDDKIELKGKKKNKIGSRFNMGNVLFGADKSKEIIQNLLKNYISKKEKEIKYFDILNSQFYTIENENDVLKFIKNYNNNKLNNKDNYYKIEPLLANFRPFVLTANENNFNEIVINNEENVFVLFYSPFSSLSKRISSTFTNLAKKFNQVKSNIKFVEIDGTKNVVDGINLEKYPALYLYKKNVKDKPIVYDGEYKEESLFKFIKNYI